LAIVARSARPFGVLLPDLPPVRSKDRLDESSPSKICSGGPWRWISTRRPARCLPQLISCHATEMERARDRQSLRRRADREGRPRRGLAGGGVAPRAHAPRSLGSQGPPRAQRRATPHEADGRRARSRAGSAPRRLIGTPGSLSRRHARPHTPSAGNRSAIGFSVPPGGIEPPTHGLGNRCSSPLSYGGEAAADIRQRSSDSSIQHPGPASNASGVASARRWTLSVLISGYGAHTSPVIGSAVAALFA
jgi:hypothetical protein